MCSERTRLSFSKNNFKHIFNEKNKINETKEGSDTKFMSSVPFTESWRGGNTLSTERPLTSLYLMRVWGIESCMGGEQRDWPGIESNEGKEEERFLKSTFFY